MNDTKYIGLDAPDNDLGCGSGLDRQAVDGVGSGDESKHYPAVHPWTPPKRAGNAIEGDLVRLVDCSGPVSEKRDLSGPIRLSMRKTRSCMDW
jgi:hypothetical protein